MIMSCIVFSEFSQNSNLTWYGGGLSHLIRRPFKCPYISEVTHKISTNISIVLFLGLRLEFDIIINAPMCYGSIEYEYIINCCMHLLPSSAKFSLAELAITSDSNQQLHNNRGSIKR